MKRKISLEFSELKENVTIELDGFSSPNTVRAIIDSLPINMVIERWGDELYSEPTQIKVGKENAKTEVNPFDVAYWPDGSALCFFYGPTPVSKQKIVPYSPVNVVGTITTRPKDLLKFLNSVHETHVRKKIAVTLR